MLGQRVGSALVGIIIILGSLFLGGYSFAIVIGVMVTLAVWEFAQMAESRGVGLNPYIITAFSLTNLLYVVFYKNLNAALPLALLLLFFTWGKEMLNGNPEQTSQRLGETLFCYIYAGVMFSYLFLILHISGHKGTMLVLFCLFVTWANDSGAYFAGKLHGRHLLCPGISPKKTVEGALGGVVLGILAGAIFGLFNYIKLGDSLLLSFLCVLVAQLGDLYESLLKRGAQVKDSGDLIPGHGGILDRFDSLLWVSPLVYYYITFLVK